MILAVGHIQDSTRAQANIGRPGKTGRSTTPFLITDESRFPRNGAHHPVSSNFANGVIIRVHDKSLIGGIHRNPRRRNKACIETLPIHRPALAAASRTSDATLYPVVD